MKYLFVLTLIAPLSTVVFLVACSPTISYKLSVQCETGINEEVLEAGTLAGGHTYFTTMTGTEIIYSPSVKCVIVKEIKEKE